MVLDENAIRLSFSVNEEDTVVKLSVLKEDWDKGLALLLEVLTRPRFEEPVVQVSKDQILTALKRQGKMLDPSAGAKPRSGISEDTFTAVTRSEPWGPFPASRGMSLETS